MSGRYGYAFPSLSREDDALCRELFRLDDWASRAKPDSLSNRELRRLLGDNHWQVIAILRQLLAAGEENER